ncbi:ATP-binding protein [Streptomyces lunaelactis]|uniref:ATP-binding protein n=1 Tax=Streptomyces lunaelactis TaxID=1535768 RepID=UPI0015847ECF|nr:ATP-binding protein [Streptomyces lunaelactis]NUK51299.1 ATP-binding protein [Streptomyces lunaelactis]NUK64685.1 ATP-binding protein [Streptomyces lunaelactis]
MTFYVDGGTRLRCVLPFKAVPTELQLLRKTVRSTLGRWGVLAVADETELIVTELATNVIKHVGEGAPATLVLEPRDDRIRVELHDKGHTAPALGSGGCDEECGRGLHLLSAMSLGWGTLLTATGKAVWCEISLEHARHCVKVQRAAELLDEYRRVVGVGSVVVPTYPVLEESVTDIIADLLHWLAVQGGDPDDILDRAQMHFEAEREAA